MFPAVKIVVVVIMVVPADYASSAITGIVMAITSWLPLGTGKALSHFLGAVALGYEDYMVPSYLGIIFAVIFYFRDLIAVGTQKALRRSFSADLKYFAYASLFTLAVGYPIAAGGWDLLGPEASDMANALIGALLDLVGVLCWKKRRAPLEGVDGRLREEDEPTLLDAIVSGIAQGFAMIGGLSATGLILLTLSGTGIKPKKALELIFMISPVYLTLKLLFLGEWSPAMPVYLPFTAFLASFVTSIIFMRLLLAAGGRLGRRTFLTLMGLVPIAVYLLEVVI